MEGIVNILKPPGMTSSNAVADVRHIFSEKRVGHTGTLDPGAAGVLPVCLGRATRLFDYLMDKHKEYIAEVCFGFATDTQDSYGKVTDTVECDVALDDVRAVLPRFLGVITQIAPDYSAVRVDGRKMYELAREGREIEKKTRDVTIFAIECLEKTGRNRYLIRIECSKGTYVRTLCFDIGGALGVPAHMSFLLRTRSGDFCVEDAYSVAELETMRDNGTLMQAVIPIDRALAKLPEIRLCGLSERKKRFILNGAEISIDKLGFLPNDCGYRTYIDDEFIGVGIVSDEAMLHIDTYFKGDGTDER